VANRALVVLDDDMPLADVLCAYRRAGFDAAHSDDGATAITETRRHDRDHALLAAQPERRSLRGQGSRCGPGA
jgi:ActR/RegA family two-component response regulator